MGQQVENRDADEGGEGRKGQVRAVGKKEGGARYAPCCACSVERRAAERGGEGRGGGKGRTTHTLCWAGSSREPRGTG